MKLIKILLRELELLFVHIFKINIIASENIIQF